MSTGGLGFPLPTGPVLPGVWAIRDAFVNLFVLSGDKGLVCVDAGWRLAAVKRGFQRLGFDPVQVKAVLLTHSDGDHVGGLSAFPEARVILGREERGLLEEQASRWLGLFHNRIAKRPLEWVSGGDQLDLGGLSLRVVAAPGHTPGSLCYLFEDRVLFAGDAVWRWGGARTLPFFNMDLRGARSSLRKVLALAEGRTILTAHAGSATGQLSPGGPSASGQAGP